jgi:hypothetical protein
MTILRRRGWVDSRESFDRASAADHDQFDRFGLVAPGTTPCPSSTRECARLKIFGRLQDCRDTSERYPVA